MLRGNDKAKLSRSDLIKKIEEQQLQIADYEKKLRDVVRAYKGLNAERDALQAVIETLGLQKETIISTERQKDEKNETICSEIDAPKEVSEESRVEVLKRSLAVLAAEKTRREAAFQSDKKILLTENEALKERLQKAADETEAQAEKLESRLVELRCKLKQIEGDREKELADHGSVLAAIQQQYAKERANSEQLEKQIAELYKKLREKEEAPKQLEADISSLRVQLSNALSDLEFWKKKAEKTPTIQMLESELKDLKESSGNEIRELERKLVDAQNMERETRLRELEQRLQELTTEMGSFDRVRADLQHRVNSLETRNKSLEDENMLLKTSKPVKEAEKSVDLESLKQHFLTSAQKLRDSKEKINFYELLGLDEITYEQKQRYDMLKDEYERYRLKAQTVLKCRALNNDALIDRSPSSLSAVVECSSCAAAEADLRHMRSVVASLHDKLHSLEIDHANAKNDYEEKTAQLQRKIINMQIAQENSASELRSQMHQKVVEVESEMQKQRIRTLDLLAEKENELEITKAILASVRSQQNVDPVDPPQNTSLRPLKYRRGRSQNFGESSACTVERRKSSDYRKVINRSSSDAGSCSSLVEELRLASPADTHISFPFPGITCTAEARNIFYEQQLARKEKDIVELRNAVHVAELNSRDIQQASFTKDLQHFEMMEKLKDEVRILEGKVKFLSSDANMEYLRNIFIQLLHCDSSSGRKHILKAIGAVLKLSITEMRAIERI